MSLTLKKFRELTKDLPDDTYVETTIEFGKPNSLRGVINQVHIIPKEHSYTNEGHITLTQCELKSKFSLVVKKWVGKNNPMVIEEQQ